MLLNIRILPQLLLTLLYSGDSNVKIGHKKEIFTCKPITTHFPCWIASFAILTTPFTLAAIQIWPQNLWLAPQRLDRNWFISF